MKIRYHHPMVYSENFKGYDNILKKFFSKVVPEQTEIDHTWSARGTQAVQYDSGDILNTLETVQYVLEAQEQNFDAVIIGCSLDIGLKESREVAEIPVVSIMESAMLASCQMGKRFSIISFGEKARVRQEELIEQYGLGKRTNGVRRFEMSLEQLGSALSDQESEPESAEEDDGETIVGCAMKTGKTRLKEVFMEEATKAVVEDNAEVIIPGCGVLAALCMVDNITCVEGLEGVPVIDTFIPALKHAEAFVLMKKALGINVSRFGLYQQPSEEVISQIKNM